MLTVENHRELLPFFIQEHVPLADKNSFRTGGNARFYTEPTSMNSFTQALFFAKNQNLEIFVLGAGANVLISDEGFSGLVIRPMITTFETTNLDNNNVLVKAGAGLSIDTLIKLCFDHMILGLEEFSGIPGNVGGAVYINLHYYEFLLEQFIVQATLIHTTTMRIITVDKDWFQFGYDQSKLQEKEYFILDATFALKKAPDELAIAHAKGRYQEIVRHRNRRYPFENTCGSFFRNFHKEEVADTEKQLIFVAYYLDQIGVKGSLSFGGATVSHQHANMIVTKNNATSADVINLAKLMQEMVYEKYHIKPVPECQLVGFSHNPLE